MSRNKEKAQAGLNRYYEQKIQDAGVVRVDSASRPKSVQKVKTVAEAQLWRKSLAGEILAKLSDINNPSLADDEIRTLNTALNKLHREKRAWEYHIKSLGGNDYIAFQKSVGIRVGDTTYFGRAKELPEAKLLAREEITEPKAPDLPLAYYGVYDREVWVETPISTSRERIMEDINTALGEQLLQAPVGEKVKLHYTNEDVERYMVEQRKKALLAQLMEG